jgi:hypothetical protein
VLSGYEAEVALCHENIKVLRDFGKRKVRNAYGYVRGVVGDNVFFYNNSLSVGLRALTERLYYVKGQDGFVPCPRPTASFTTLRKFRDAVVRNLPERPPVWTNLQFVQSYTGPKFKSYMNALNNLTLRGVRRQYGYWKTFIKAEFYNGTTKSNPCPRLIQPRSTEYNILIGRYLKPAEKLIYKAIDRVFGYHVVMKCDNPWQRAKTIVQYWNEFSNPVFVGLDASRFDQHVSAEALSYEHSLYNKIFASKELEEFLRWQINNVGYANFSDGSLKYTVQGVRGSGDMNTALGNVFLMCSITHHYLEGLGIKYRFINDGDDCGVFLEASNLHLLDDLPAHHLAYGFEMDVEDPVYELEHVEFCQSRPINLGDGNWMMVRNIHKAIQNDWLNVNSVDYASLNDRLAATGRCGLALYADVPVLGAMYEKMASVTHDPVVVDRLLSSHFSGVGRTWRMFASQHRAYPVVLTEARASLFKAFGLLPSYQEQLEEEFRAFILPQSEKVNFVTDPKSSVQYYVDRII